MIREEGTELIRSAARAAVQSALERWLDRHGLASWDPYDALASPLLCRLQRFPLPARLCMQAVKRSPMNLRPWLGVPRIVHTKSLSDLAQVECLRAAAGVPGATARIHERLDALRQRRVPVANGIAWGMDLPYVSRFVTASPTTPNLFQTMNAAAAFLAGYEATGEEAYLATAFWVVDFVERELGRLEDSPTRVAWRYYPGHDACVYNVNALLGAWLQRLGRLAGRDDLVSLGRRTLQFVVTGQNPDGSWSYESGPRGRWVDGFHTGYVLESLLQAVHIEGDSACAAGLKRGIRYYAAHLITPTGLPRYTDRSILPIDVQNCAQAIQTLAQLGRLDPHFLPRACQTADLVIQKLFRWSRQGPEPEGYFLLARGRWFANRLPAVRWGQAPMLLALTHLQDAARRAEAGSR